jgi:hypothetical protein
VQELHPSWHRSLVEMHAAALAKDDPAFLRALDFFLGSTKGGRFEKPMVDYNREVFAPLLRSPFHVAKAYASGLYSEVQRLAEEISAVKRQGEYVPPPPESTMMSRRAVRDVLGAGAPGRPGRLQRAPRTRCCRRSSACARAEGVSNNPARRLRGDVLRESGPARLQRRVTGLSRRSARLARPRRARYSAQPSTAEMKPVW